MTLTELKSHYPYMFEGPNMGLSFYVGWWPIFEDACLLIDEVLGEDKRGFHWIQCKEKWGSARFYFSLAGDARMVVDVAYPDGLHEVHLGPTNPKLSVANRIDEIVSGAEERTRSACIVCGLPAQLDGSSGWVMLLCNKHTSKDVRSSHLT